MKLAGNNKKEDFFHNIIDKANVLIFYLDIKGNVILSNNKAQAITGIEQEDLAGKNWLLALYGNDSNVAIKQQMFKAMMDDSIAYKRPNNFEGLINEYKNKEERFISWSITPILDEKKDLEGILLIGNDITEFKAREASVKKIDETLKNIFSSIKEYALYVINLDGNITYFGMGSEQVFGWHKNEIIFKHVGMLYGKGEMDSNRFSFLLEQVKRYGQYEVEAELMKKDGTLFPVILTISQFLDTEGNLIGYVFIAKDITERKKLEYQIFQAEKLAAIGQLAAGMAHEINNPLFVISGRLQMIMEENRFNAEVTDSLNIINSQADRIRNLVDRMLKFSRHTPPKLEILNINEVIENVLPFLSYHKLPSHNIQIDKYLDKNLPAIKGDLNQLQEVFINLLINAYQSMPNGGSLTIATSNLKNLFAQVRISDTGSGISEKNLKNIFMPFFSTKKEGTGLGLSICYNIIKNHSGTIDIESQVGKGTTFIVKLPFA